MTFTIRTRIFEEFLDGHYKIIFVGQKSPRCEEAGDPTVDKECNPILSWFRHSHYRANYDRTLFCERALDNQHLVSYKFLHSSIDDVKWLLL